MRTLLERYIAKSIILTTLLIILVIASILLLILLLGELKSIGEGDYDLLQVLFYVFLRLPSEVYQFSPIFLLLGTIIGLNLLSSHRELVVMRASGLSTRQLLWTIFCTGFLLSVTLGSLGEWVAPKLSYIAEMKKENAKNAGQAVVTAAGVWFHIDNNFIHVEQVIDRHLLEKVTRYQFDEAHHLIAVYYAKKLALYQNHWVMNDVVQTHFFSDHAVSKHFKQLPWDVKFNSALLSVGVVGPNEMTLNKLRKYADYLDQNGLQSTEYRYQFWQRVFQPLASIILIFIGVPFVLRQLKSTLLGWRLLSGIFIGFAFFILNAMLVQAAIVFQLPPFYAALLPVLSCLLIAALLIRSMLY